MAITDAPRPLALPTGGNQPQPKPLGVFTRPRATTGWRSWVTTVDHKKIAQDVRRLRAGVLRRGWL